MVAAHTGPTRSRVRRWPSATKSSSPYEAIRLLPAVAGGSGSRFASVRTSLATSSGRRWASTIATEPPMLCPTSSAPRTPAASSAAARASAWSSSV